MENFLIKDIKGNSISAELIASFFCPETNKNYVILNNKDLVFSKDSAYNNLDVFEITKEENNIYYVSNIPDSEWDMVQETMIKEFFSNIK